MFPFGCRSPLPPRLPRPVPPFPGETTASYIYRLAAASELHPSDLRAHLAGRREREPVALDSLAAAAGRPRHALAWALPELRPGSDPALPGYVRHDLLALRGPVRLVSLRLRLAARRDVPLPLPPDLARICGPSPPPLAVRHRRAVRDHPGTRKALPVRPPPRTPGRHRRHRRGIPHHRALGPARLLPRPPRSPDPGTARRCPHNRQTAVIRGRHGSRDLPRDRRSRPHPRHAPLAQ